MARIGQLTQAQVRTALKAGEAALLKDGGSLFLKVTGKGSGRWIYRGRMAGTKSVIDAVCGGADMSLEEARARRAEYKELLSKGINPAQARKQASSMRFEAVATRYLDTRGDLTAKTLEVERGRLQTHLKALHGRQIAQIRRSELKAVLDGIVERSGAELARRCAGTLCQVFAYALDSGLIESDPAARISRTLPRRTGETEHFAAAVTPEDAASVFSSLWAYLEAGTAGPEVTAAVKVLCYLPLRISNLLGSKWEDVDLEAGVWTFPRTKNGQSYTLPIPSQVEELLRGLRMRTGAQEHVFASGRARAGHLTAAACAKVLREAGIPQEKQTLHGFRAVFSTLCREAGLPGTVVERALFHTLGQTERAYARDMMQEPLKLALAFWADYVDALRTGSGAVPAVPEKLQRRH